MIQIGNTYSTKSTRSPLITIIDIPGTLSHPVVGIDNKKRLFHYTKEGKFIDVNFPHEMDLANVE